MALSEDPSLSWSGASWLRSLELAEAEYRSYLPRESNIVFHTPAHKQTDPAKLPGQIRNSEKTTAKEYKPTHGGYPDATR